MNTAKTLNAVKTPNCHKIAKGTMFFKFFAPLRSFCVFAVLTVFFLTIGCSKPPIVEKQTQFLMGTIVEITIADNDINKINQAFDAGFSTIRNIEGLMSNFIPASEINKINNLPAGNILQVSPDIYYVLKKAKEFNELSDGAFDITVWPLVELWGFGKTKIKEIPPVEKINEAREFVGSENMLLDEKLRSVSIKKQGVKIVLGAIAKGYAVDKAIEALKKEGITNAIVNAGGDIYCLGKKGSKFWNIGIQHPRQKNKILTTLKLENKAVASSGDYEKFFVINNRKYSHIIDPKTGYPVENPPLSVTIIADDCLTADALATCAYVLGPEKGLKLIEKFKGTEAIIITEENGRLKSYLSKGLLGKVSIKD